MGKRIDRYEYKKRIIKQSRYRVLVFLFCVVIFLGGLLMVDNSLRSLLDSPDMKIFNYENIGNKYNIKLFNDKNFNLSVDKSYISLDSVKIIISNITSYIKDIFINLTNKL